MTMRAGTSGLLLWLFAFTWAGLAAGAGPARSRPTQVLRDPGTNRFLVVESGAETLVQVNPDEGTITRRPLSASGGQRIAPGPAAIAFNPSHSLQAFANPWSARVLVLPIGTAGTTDKSQNDPAQRLFELPSNPQALAFTPDGLVLAVACDPSGREARPVCFVDLKTGKVTRRPIPGSSNLRGIAVDPSGRFALAVHLVPKSDLPATQIEQGWVFSNVVSYVPLDPQQPIVTFPLDLRTQGFANPEGVAIAPDGQRAYIAHAGADVVSVLDLPALVAAAAAARSPDYERFDDFRMTRRYVKARIPVGTNPRGIEVSRDGKWIAVANRLDDSISLIDAVSHAVVRTIELQPGLDTQADDLARDGEKLFQSGKLSFSGQFSCASCHPDGHSDGLNWDLPADGFNNFHNTKSLLGTAGTAPYGWTGTSPDLRERFTGTLRHLFQHEPNDAEVAALDAFLSQLDYPPLLPRADAPSPAVTRGRLLFQNAARCHECHSGMKFTDRKSHDVGTGSGRAYEFDTPSLYRISETAPYLHDGRATTLDEIFTRFNPAGLHGAAADLSPDELRDLVAYLKTL